MKTNALTTCPEPQESVSKLRFCTAHPAVRMVPRHDPFPAPLSLLSRQDHCWKCDEAAAAVRRDAKPLDIGLNRAI